MNPLPPRAVRVPGFHTLRWLILAFLLALVGGMAPASGARTKPPAKLEARAAASRASGNGAKAAARVPQPQRTSPRMRERLQARRDMRIAKEMARIENAYPSKRQLEFTAKAGGFAHADKLLDHYVRHGKQVGARSPGDYAFRAQLLRIRSSPREQKVDASGRLRIWDPRSNEFGSFDRNGQTSTLFKPSPREHGYKRNSDYWGRQEGR